MAKKKKSFEDWLERAEEISDALEEGNLDLADALKLYKEGMTAVGELKAQLDEARNEIISIKEGDNGKIIETKLEDAALTEDEA